MTKIVNYTPEQTAEIVAAYMLAPTKATVESLAEQFGKTTRSIIAKLSREKVYRKAEYVTKQGTKPVAKEIIVAELAKALNTTAENLAGLEKANKNALLLILAALSVKA